MSSDQKVNIDITIDEMIHTNFVPRFEDYAEGTPVVATGWGRGTFGLKFTYSQRCNDQSHRRWLTWQF